MDGSKLIKENQKILNAINVVIDAVIIVITYFIAYKIRVSSDSILYIESISFRQYTRYLLVVVPVYIMSYYLFKLYTTQRLKSITHEISKIVRANVIATAVFFVVLFFMKTVDYSRYMVIIFMMWNIALTVIYRVILRYILRRIRKKGFNIKRAFLIGTSDTAMDFLQKTQKNMQWGYKIIGIFEEVVDEKKQAKLKNKFPLDYIPRYTYAKLEKLLSEKLVDEVVIGMRLTEYEKLENIIRICEKSGVKTQIIPDYLKYIPAKPDVEQIDDITIINIRHIPLDNPINKFIKRLTDIIVSLSAIVIASPIMILTAIAIRLESEGSVIYKQERVGYNRKNFYMYKFRSMKVQSKEEEKYKWTTKDDDRKTKVGKFIRKTNIDELPQFFNVLKGDMSFIGPRPERPFFVEKFKEEIPKYMIKHQVRPGITGWAQANGLRGDTSIKKRIEYDIFYIENWSLTLDIKIVILTIINGFKNAY